MKITFLRLGLFDREPAWRPVNDGPEGGWHCLNDQWGACLKETVFLYYIQSCQGVSALCCRFASGGVHLLDGEPPWRGNYLSHNEQQAKVDVLQSLAQSVPNAH